MSGNWYIYKTLSLWCGKGLTHAVAQDHREAKDAACTLSLSERDIDQCYDLKWKSRYLLTWHHTLLGIVLSDRAFVTEKRAHCQFHLAKHFAIPVFSPANKHIARGTRRE